jgi:hypothetical protein
MLPGLRLIAVSFLCGFVVMFVGLRAVFSLNIVHASLPVMADQAAQSAPAGMIEPRGAPSAMPALYDLRLVANTVAPQLAILTMPIVERVPPEPAPLIEDAFEESPSPRAGETAPQADTAFEQQAALADDAAGIAPDSTASAGPSIATPAEPTSDSQASEPSPESLLEPISQPTAPVESKVAIIAIDPEGAAVAIETPKPAETKLKRTAAKPARKKRARVARSAPPQNRLGTASALPLSNQGSNLFGTAGGNSGNGRGNPFGNQSGNPFGNQSGNSLGNR